MPVVAAAAAAVFSSAVTFATAAGTAALTAVGAAGVAGVTIAGVQVATIVGALQIGTTAMSLFSMTRKPKAGAGSASPIAFKADPNAYIPFIAGGPVGTGGNIVFAQTAGSKNAYLTYSTVLSHGGPLAAAPTFLANDAAVTFTGDGGSGATGTYRNRMWQKFALGAALGTALAMTATGNRDTPGNNGGHPVEWDASHKLAGMAHSLWTLKSDPDKYPQVPKPTWVATGGPVYDMRKDSTFPGGVGPQRANDRTTWSTDGNQNPFLQAVTFCLGHYFNGVRVGGVGVPASGIDMAAFANGANVADANGWKIAWVWNTGMRKWDVLVTMLQAGAGTPLVRGSKISCMVETPRVSLGEITEADLRGDFSVTGSANKRERKNAIIPRCKSSAHKWTVQPFGKVTAATYVAEDRGRENAQEVEYESVSGPGAQVRQLATYDLANIREGLVGILPLSASFLKYRAGDCITVNAPSTLMNGQKVVILKREFDTRSRIVSLTVRSETDGKHAFALGQTNVPPPSPVLTGIDPLVVQPPSPTQWLVEPGVVPGGGLNGGEVPVIVIRPTNPDGTDGNGGAHGDDPAATAILVRWRPTATPLAAWAYGEWPPNSDRIELPGLQPGVSYDVEIAYRVRGIDGQWQPYGSITNGQLIATDTRLVGGRPVASILSDLDAVPGKISAAVSAAVGTLNGSIALLNSALALVQADINDPATGLKVRVGQAETATALLASRVTVVEQQITTPTTGILARTASLESATALLASGKADASRVAVVEASIIGGRPSVIADADGSAFSTSSGAATPLGAARVGSDAQGFYFFTSGTTAMVARQAIPLAAGQVLSARAVFDQTGVADSVRLSVWPFTADGTALSGIGGATVAAPIGDGQTIARTFGMPGSGAQTIVPANTASVRIGFQPGRSGTAGVARVRSLAIDDGTTTTDLLARTATLEQAASDLAAGKADASRVALVEAAINTPATGILARVLTAENAVSSLTAGKADASRVTSLEAVAIGTTETPQISDLTRQFYSAATTSGSSGDPAAMPNVTASIPIVDTDRGPAFRMPLERYLWPKAVWPLPTSPQTVRVVVIARQISGPLDSGYVYTRGFKADHTSAGSDTNDGTLPVAALNVWQTFTYEVSLAPLAAANAVNWRPGFRMLQPYEIRSITWEYITGEAALSARAGTLENAVADLATGKAEASRVTLLEAKAQGAVLNRNSDFSVYPGATGYPTGVVAYGTPQSVTRVTSDDNGNACRVAAAANTLGGIRWTFGSGSAWRLNPFPKSQKWVVEWSVKLVAGSFAGAGVYCSFREASGTARNTVNFSFNAAGNYGAGTIGRTYTGSVLWDSGTVYEITQADLYGMNHFASHTGAITAANTLEWNYITLRPATDAEARVVTTEAAVSDLYGKTYARWSLGATVPGATAFIYAEAETSPGATPTSSVAIGARVFTVYNPANDDWIPAMQVTGGNAIFTGGLQAGAFIRLGTGAGWPVALQSKSFLAADGAAIAFGTNLGAVPSYEFQRDNLLPLATGETYALKLTGLTATGGTVSAKISTPGTPGNVTNTVDAASGTGPTRQMTKSGADATSGDYTVTVKGTARGRYPGLQEGDYFGGVAVNVFARKAGVWSQVGTMTAPISYYSDGSGPLWVSFVGGFEIADTFQMGDGVEAFGVSRGGATGICNTTSTVDDLFSVAWTTPGSAGGTRTALASGAKTTVKILPRN